MTEGWARFYDELAPDYDALTADDAWSPNERAAELLAPLGLDPTRVLDLGAGTGQTAAMLRGLHPAAELTLVDPSEAMIALARDRALGARFVVADAVGFLAGATGTWDLVTALGFLELVPDLDEVLRLAASRLAPGGHLVVSHEPLVEGGTVQARPVSRVRDGLEVHRRSSGAVERMAASYGLERVTSDEVVAFERGDGDGPAVYELVVWRCSGR